MEPDNSTPNARIEIELRKLDVEERSKREELAERRALRESDERKQAELNELRRKELAVSEGRGVRFTAAQATVAAAVLAVISGASGSAITAYFNRDIAAGTSSVTRDVETGKLIASRDIETKKAQAEIDIEKLKAQASIDLQQKQFETTLILTLTKNEDLATRIENLRFYVKSGLLADKDGKLAEMVKNLEVPYTPSSSADSGTRPIVATDPGSTPGCAATDGWAYSQSSGSLCHDGTLVAKGYSGFKENRNNPDSESVDGGPIPVGVYLIGAPENLDSPGPHGPFVLRLTPDSTNKMYGRENFLVHGDNLANLGNASHGSIVIGRLARQFLSTGAGKKLKVIR